jgi:hypothetical protein
MNSYSSLIICVFSLIAAGAAQADRQPARVGSGKDSLGARIEFPELKGDATATVRCAAQVEDGGDMEKNGCYNESPSDQLFIPAISEAARKAEMQPASLDGRRLEVYFQYRVKFEKKGDDTTITVLENPGVTENVEAYGEDHVAAQRAIGDENWQKVCPSRAQYLVWLRAHVAPDGAVSNPSLTHGGGIMPTPRCQQAILDTVQNSIFFPALHDGQPVPSTYVEPFGN